MTEKTIEATKPAFLQIVPVVLTDRLNRDFIESCLNHCYLSENGIEQEYVEWNTGWMDSTYMRSLSEYLLNQGLPKDTYFLLKMTDESLGDK